LSSIATLKLDLFEFSLELIEAAKELEFAICFEVQGKEHWQNNNGENFLFGISTESIELVPKLAKIVRKGKAC